jgi:hypothetical protein
MMIKLDSARVCFNCSVIHNTPNCPLCASLNCSLVVDLIQLFPSYRYKTPTGDTNNPQYIKLWTFVNYGNKGEQP